MDVPAEIEAVERPENTVVVDIGGSGAKRWAVRSKVRIKLVEGCPLAIGGRRVMGYIVDGAYEALPDTGTRTVPSGPHFVNGTYMPLAN